MIIYEVVYTEENKDLSGSNNLITAYFPNKVVAKSFASKKKKECLLVYINKQEIGNSKKNILMFLNKEINNENSKND